MEASLAVPTATSNRVIPVKNMEENRRILNRHREALGLSKISFTHFVAWAIVRALEKHPGMNDAYGEADGRPARIRKKAVNLGVAIDVTKKDGSRSLLVPNIRDAGKMTFAGFLEAFDVLVAKARKGTIEPDLFAGTTISLTNPGTIGTTASAPRLMPGQGTIVATGAMGYPAEFQAMPDEVMSALGVSRVMNVSSTYDHRIIQGAESGAFLATLQDLLLGGDGSTTGSSRTSRSRTGRCAGRRTRARRFSAARTASRPSRSRRASSRSSTRTACAATSSRT